MAQIELRNTVVRMKDGFGGTAQNNGGASAGATSMGVKTLTGLPDASTTVPVGARFYANAHPDAVYTVTNSTGTPTSNIEFEPDLEYSISNNDAITFLPAQIEIKIGDGNMSWTENREMEYVLDRGDLDTVREGDQQPMEVNIDFVYEFYTSVGGGDWEPTPIDFLKRLGDASNLFSASSDPCEPFALDIEIEYTPPCGSEPTEIITFPEFRYDDLSFDLREGTISMTGRCNSTSPIVQRVQG